jgi:threonine dehydrogenase-like Zn-dependent dehydrogenase
MRIQGRYHWLVGPGDIRLQWEELDEDELGREELLCRTLVSAISPGTELAAFEGREPLRRGVPAYPRWLGYMNVAEVIGAGSDARAEFPVGAIVYTHAAHRSHFRTDRSKVLGLVPDRLSAADASLCYLYRLAWVGLRRGRGNVAARVAVVGLGAIGLCAVELAAKFGCRSIAISDHANARQVAQGLGARSIGRDEAEECFVKQKGIDDEHFDCVLATTNGWRDWQIAMSLARFGGIISVVGFPGRGQDAPKINPLLPALFYDRQLTIMSAGLAGPMPGDGREDPSALRHDTVEIFRWMRLGEIIPARIRMGMHVATDLAGAYARLKSKERGVGTLVLDWAGA